MFLLLEFTKVLERGCFGNFNQRSTIIFPYQNRQKSHHFSWIIENNNIIKIWNPPSDIYRTMQWSTDTNVSVDFGLGATMKLGL